MSTLMNERTGLSAMIGSRRGEGMIQPALATWAEVSAADRSPVDRDRLARLCIAADVLRYTFERAAGELWRPRFDAERNLIVRDDA